MDSIFQHSCFGAFDDTCQDLSMDETGKVLITSIKNFVYLCNINSTKFSLRPIMSFHSYCLDKSSERNLMETSACENLTDVTADENNASETQRVDEELISIVQLRPALYDHRISTQQRTKLKKKDLWQEVSNCLGGKLIQHYHYINLAYFL